jgi:hypothetical protein
LEQQAKEHLELFLQEGQQESDAELANILCLSLEQKFLLDLNLHSPKLKDTNIVNDVESWVVSELNYRMHLIGKNQIFSVLNNQIGQNTYPYAVVFSLFMIGKHKIALEYSRKFCSQKFSEMYGDYIDKYGCKGFPEHEIMQRYQDTMQEGLLDGTDF